MNVSVYCYNIYYIYTFSQGPDGTSGVQGPPGPRGVHGPPGQAGPVGASGESVND